MATLQNINSVQKTGAPIDIVHPEVEGLANWPEVMCLIAFVYVIWHSGNVGYYGN